MEFNDQLRIARESKGWTQTQMGERLDPSVSRQAVIYWEEGQYIPRAGKLRQLEKILETRFDVTGSGQADGATPLPPGVTPEHIHVALLLSRLSAPERDAFYGLILIATARVEGKDVAEFFTTNKTLIINRRKTDGSKRSPAPKKASTAAGRNRGARAA